VRFEVKKDNISKALMLCPLGTNALRNCAHLPRIHLKNTIFNFMASPPDISKYQQLALPNSSIVDLQAVFVKNVKIISILIIIFNFH